MNLIEIKQANVNDIELLALIGRITWAETFGSLFRRSEDVKNYVDKNFSICTVKTFLEHPNTYFWIAYYNKFPVGYAKIEMHVDSDLVRGQNICKLCNIYVLRDFHSKRIGLGLWNMMLEKVKDKQCDKMWLSVLHSNDKAINFYKKMLFIMLGILILKLE